MIFEDWRKGEYYELAVELGARSDQRLVSALRATSEFTNAELISESGDQGAESAILGGSHLFGSFAAGDVLLRYGVVAVREDDGPDWFDLYFPMGALEALGVDLPDVLERSAVKPMLDRFLLAVGQAVYQRAPFQLGIVGWEVSGFAYAKQFTDKGPPAAAGLWYLWQEDGALRTIAPIERDAAAEQ